MTDRLTSWLGEPGLVLAALGLSVFGVAMIYSAGVLNMPNPAVADAWTRQLLWLVLALGGFAVIRQLQPGWLEWAAFPGYVLATVLLGATLVVGTGAGTAEGVGRWLQIGGFRFQPSELAKLACILAMARLLSSREEPPSSLRDLLAPGALIVLPLGLVALQPDLGTALAFVGIFFAAIFWAGTPLLLILLVATPGLALIMAFDTRVWSLYFVLLALLLFAVRARVYFSESVSIVLANLAAGTVALPLWNSLAEYQRNRLLVFLDPGLDPQGAGWNLIQSQVAIGSGGLTGQGFTLGTQKRLDFLPEQHTDFIFSVVGEELGFVGTVLVIAAFAFLLYRLIRLAERVSDPFAGLVVFGIFGAWLVHVFINIGMTIGLVPITGIPLPFVSYGGTFLVVSWVAVATAVSLAREG